MFYAIFYDHFQDNPCLISSGNLHPDQPLYQFRLYDGDDELMFSGVSTDRETEDAFQPLDDLQESQGVTRIDYLYKTGWHTL